MFYWGYVEVLFVPSIHHLFYTHRWTAVLPQLPLRIHHPKKCFDGCTCNPCVYLEEPCDNHKARREAALHQRQCSCKSEKRTTNGQCRRAFRYRLKTARSVNGMELSGPRKSSCTWRVPQRLSGLGVDLTERSTTLGMRDGKSSGFLQCDQLV